MSDSADQFEARVAFQRTMLIVLCACVLIGIACSAFVWLQQHRQIARIHSAPESSALLDNTQSKATVDPGKQLEIQKTLHRGQMHFAICIALTLVSLLALWAFYHQLVYRRQRRQARRTHRQLIATRQRLDAQSKRDALTDTSNRKAITRFLSDIQRKGQQIEGEFVALAILDIDHFQQINDVLGYFAGDEVLRQAAKRIHGELRVEDKLGRLEADRFAIVLCGLVAPRTGEAIIHRIQQTLAQPIDYKGSPINITTTVGASVQETSVMDIAELFKLSDQALQAAKRDHRGSVLLLSDQAQEALSRQRVIVNAIKSHQPGQLFELAYQPIVRLTDRRIAGFECLLRWASNTPPDLHADEFVPILEMYDDIHAVGDWVVNSSLEQFRQWRSDYRDYPLFISINISARQLEDEDFARRVMEMTSQQQIDPAEVSLELTETVAIKHLESGRKQLALLRNMGFGISLDDFGTGYSSLQYLKTMPASTVKIDQTFIRHMMHDARDAAIVDSAIHIANAIGLKVVAEGVDSEEQESKLRSAGCQYVQGYHYSPPLNVEATTQLLLQDTQ